MATTIKISDNARAVLARATITATTVALPPETLDRALYVEVDKALKAAGGKWSKKNRVHEFTRDPREALGLTVAEGTAVNHQQVKQAFYTPEPLAQRVAQWADIKPGMTVLEPSCGEGALIKAVLAIASVEITGYDTDPFALDRARTRCTGYESLSLEIRDFLKVEAKPIFDRVVMNPPFTRGQDIEHVTHALGFVKPGGILVSITSPSWMGAASKKAQAFRERLYLLGHETEIIEKGAFKASGTGIATMMLKVHVPST